MNKKNDLSDLTIEDLENELKRRKEEANKPPTPMQDPGFSKVQNFAQDIITSIHKTGYPPKDYKHYMYELVMKAVFGPQVFDCWINKHNLD